MFVVQVDLGIIVEEIYISDCVEASLILETEIAESLYTKVWLTYDKIVLHWKRL